MGLRWLPRTRAAAWAYIGIGLALLALLIVELTTGFAGSSLAQYVILAFVVAGFTAIGVVKLLVTRS